MFVCNCILSCTCWFFNSFLDYFFRKFEVCHLTACRLCKKWIFDNCETGTQVEFYSSEDPGPLGKPETQKISDYSEELKNWDPTDEKQENPWIIYKKKVKEQEEIKLFIRVK